MLETSATHQIPQGKNIPYQPLLIKPIFSLLANTEKKHSFFKLVFQLKQCILRSPLFTTNRIPLKKGCIKLVNFKVVKKL